jgi:hypothetical protein
MRRHIGLSEPSRNFGRSASSDWPPLTALECRQPWLYRKLSRANASRVPWEHDSSSIERILPPMDNTEIGDFVATAVNWDEEPYCVELADAALPPFGATCPTLW